MSDLRVKDLLDTAVGQPPPGRYDLDVAVRSGQRRRAIRTAATLVSTTGVVALLAAGAWSVAGQTASAPPASSAATSAPAPATSPSVSADTPSPEPRHLTSQQLESLARQIASATGGTVEVEDRQTSRPGDGSFVRSVALRVTLEGRGSVRVAAITSADDNTSVSTWAEGCALSNGGTSDGKYCSTISLTETLGIWSQTYDEQVGRQSIRLAADLASGDTLTLTVDNYVEQPDGAKTVGPSWSEAGITAQTLTDAASSVAGAG